MIAATDLSAFLVSIQEYLWIGMGLFIGLFCWKVVASLVAWRRRTKSDLKPLAAGTFTQVANGQSFRVYIGIYKLTEIFAVPGIDGRPFEWNYKHVDVVTPQSESEAPTGLVRDVRLKVRMPQDTRSGTWELESCADHVSIYVGQDLPNQLRESVASEVSDADKDAALQRLKGKA